MCAVATTSFVLAETPLHPGGIIAWACVGLIAGWLASHVMKGSGYGLIRDLVLGLLGALIGGFIFRFFAEGAVGFWGSIGVAFVGACLLVGLLRMVSSRPST
jgi:uncharacterized membrane protein YeaQ/YmgE (transglycosylase-associated protein family)